MSKDLTAHSILKPELGILDIKTLQDLREMCVYVIYISTFQHSWVNHKQYDDGGDIEFKNFDETTGTVTLVMKGSCAGCPSSEKTLRDGILKML